jgi:hypothetical protein
MKDAICPDWPQGGVDADDKGGAGIGVQEYGVGLGLLWEKRRLRHGKPNRLGHKVDSHHVSRAARSGGEYKETDLD